MAEALEGGKKNHLQHRAHTSKTYYFILMFEKEPLYDSIRGNKMRKHIV